MTAPADPRDHDAMDSLRASDADRDRAVTSLGRHAEAGRLTADELEERVERAYAARTVAELDALQRDLPAEAAPRRRERPPLALLAVLLVAAGLAGTAAVGHPIAPLFLLAFLVWRFAWWRPSAVAG
jgi:Domain of unknown function (DUF1707)